MPFLLTSDLATWANRDGSAAAFPVWVEQLIRAGVEQTTTIEFQKGKFTNQPGADGRVTGAVIRKGFEQFIPKGDSVWEISVQDAQITAKIKKDALKRAAATFDPKRNAFVFVTPRSIHPGTVTKLKGQIKRAAPWKQVVILHGQLVYDWMTLTPMIALSFARQVHGVADGGVTTLDDGWAHIAGVTNPPLTEELAVSKRDKDAKALPGHQPAYWKRI